MPSAPPVLRPRPAPEIKARQVEDRREADRRYDAARRQRPWRAWYGTARWQGIRAGVLAEQPLCVMCDALGLVEPATVVDHVEPHRGDAGRFWSGPFQALCASCHSRHKQRQEAGRG